MATKIKRQSLHKICVCCEHFHFDPGEDDWSAVTPGYDWYIACDENGFENLSGTSITEEQYRNTLLTADSCKNYKEREVE